MKTHTYRAMMVSVLVGAMTVCGIAQATPYYWDTDDTIGGFGNASGVWGTSAFWSPDINGASASALTTITTSDGVNFGTATLALGATAANVGVAAAGVTVNSITFGAGQTTPIVLGTAGNTITLGGTTPTITVNNVADTISSILAGSGASLTKAGTGTLTLSGNNTYSGATTISTGTLKAGSSTALPSATTLNVNSTSIFDLNGYNATVAAVGAGSSTATITNSAAGSGTNTLTISAFTVGLASLMTDGATAKTALIVTNNGNTPNFANANNTFSGGLTFSSGNTRIYQGGITTTLSGSTILKSTFGTGTIYIGNNNNTGNAQLAITWSNQLLYNPIVFNAAAYADGGKAAIRADGGGLQLYGQLTAGASDINISAQATQAATAFGQLTSSGANGLTLKTPGNGTGTFTLTLSNTSNPANDYAGNTTLQNLTILALGAANQIPNGAGKGNLSNSGTFNMGGFSETINGLSGAGIVDGVSGTPTLTVGDNNAASTFSGVIKNTAGTLTLIKIGSGTLTLSGVNTYGGSTTINAGSLQGVVGGSCANSTVILNATTATNSVSITDNTKGWNNAALTVSAAGVLEFNFGAITPSTSISPLTITGAAAFTATPAVSVIVNTSSLAAGTYPLMTWGSTSGTAPTTANLTATLPAGTVGSLSVSGNTLNLVVVSTVAYWDNNGATAGFGTAAGTWASPTTGDTTQGWSFDTAGGTLPADVTTTLNNPVNFGNGATGLGAGTITVSGVVTNGSMTFATGSGAISLSGGTITFPAAGTITVNNTSDAISSVLAGAGTSLTKAGTGTLTLSGTNTYAGVTTISVGTLKAGSTTGLSTNSALSVAAGATLDLGGYNNTIKSLDIGTATSIITDSSSSGSGGTLKISTVMPAGPNANLFTGSLGLQIFGGSSVNTILGNANNTYSGGTILGNGSGSTGTRILINGATIGTGTPGALTKGYFGTGPIFIGAATTDQTQIMLQAGTGCTINNAIVVNSAAGLGGADGGAFRVDSAGNVIAGTINANLAPVAFHNNQPSAVSSITLNNKVFGNFGLTLLATVGAGTSLNVILANTSLVNTNSYAGDTIISSVKETLTLGAAEQIPNGIGKGNLVMTNGTFNLGGFSETINGLSGSGIVDGVSGTPTLIVGDNDATGTTNTFSGVIKNTAGTLSLIKIGSGTLTLSGTNTYSGATAVSNGTLSVNGSLTNANITVAAGATLTGAGTIRCHVSASTNDLITVSGTAALSELTLALDVQGLLPIGSYVLATGLGTTQFKAVTGIPQQERKSIRVTYVAGQLVLGVYPNGTMISIF